MAATAADVLQGHVRDEQKTSAAGRPDSTPRGAVNEKVDKANSLSDKYGAVANSPTVAAAIAKAEALGGVEKLERAAGAKAAADREEALAHGQFLPGMDQTSILMHGFVPPGMSQEQAAMLSKGLPKLPVTPRSGPITPEVADRMAGMPPDPGAGLPGVQAENQQIYESYMRQRFGPVSLPPLHRGHNVAPVFKVSGGTAHRTDNQMSLIPAQYNYDGGTGPASIREMTDASGNTVAQYGYDPYGRQTRIGGTGPDADFGYAGYYVHQRSGLNLAVHRAYSPSLGRWLNRDPIQDPTFGIAPESPEPRTPSNRTNRVSQAAAAPLLALKNDPVVFSQVLRHVNLPRREWHPGLNPYVYVGNNPVNLIDPSGLSPNPCPSLWPDNWFNCASKCAAQCSADPDYAGCFLRCYTICVWE